MVNSKFFNNQKALKNGATLINQIVEPTLLYTVSFVKLQLAPIHIL